MSLKIQSTSTTSRQTLSRVFLFVLCFALPLKIHGLVGGVALRDAAVARSGVSPSVPAGPSSFYVVDASGNLGTVDASTGVSTLIGSTGKILTDLAITSSGAMWGTDFDTLYSVNPATGVATAVGPLGVNGMNALVGNGPMLIGASSTTTFLYSVNTATGAATPLTGTLGKVSAGDLAFHGSSLYGTVVNGAFSDLVQITLSGNSFTSVNFGHVTHDKTLFGLVDSADGNLYGVDGTSVLNITPSNPVTSTVVVADYSANHSGLVAGLGGAVAQTNLPPTITAIADQTTPEGTATGAIAFTISDAETAAGSLVVSGTSLNTFLVPNDPAHIAFAGAGANRTITVTPKPNMSGTTTITVAVSDGTLSGFSTFLLTVTAVNAPTITPIGTQIVNEDIPTPVLPFTVSDAVTPAGDLIVSGTSATGLVTVPNIAFGGAGANRTVRVTPSFNQHGMTTITVKADDGTGIASTAFLLVVVDVDDAPTIENLVVRPQTTNEDTPIGPTEFNVFDADTPLADLTVAGVSSNVALVPNANIVFGPGSSLAKRTFAITPAPNQSGQTTITVGVSDGDLSASTSFLLTVTAVNDAPVIAPIAAQTTNEDTPAAIAFTVDDVDTPLASLALSGTSTNIALVPNANISFSGNGTNRTVTVTPAANQSGTTTIAVTVGDGSLSNSSSFVLTVTAVNDAPTVTPIAGQTINEDTATGGIAFTVDDVDSPVGSLIVSGSSSDTTLVPNANISFGGAGANRTITVTPAANQNGTATITVSVSDGSVSGSTSFLLTVTAVNDGPTIGSIAGQTIPEGTTTPIPFTVDDIDTPLASLILSGTSSNQAVVPNGNISFGGDGSARTVSVTPAANQLGPTTITVCVSDGSLSTCTPPFVLTVVPAAPIVTATVSSPLHVTLFWDAAANTTYTVKRGGSTGTEAQLVTGLVAGEYPDGNVVRGQTYFYVVTATRGGFESANSFEIAITAIIPNDFDGDGQPDLLWRNLLTGDNQVWTMAGNAHVDTIHIDPEPDLAWSIVATADVDGDGFTDILWRNRLTGANRVWFMTGVTHTSTGNFDAQADLNWELVGAADFSRDGHVDLLWRNSVTGDNQLWLMNGTAHTGSVLLTPVPDPTWAIVGTADFNADGQADVLWRNAATGDNAVWYMADSARASTVFLLAVPDLTWAVMGTVDVNGDGRPEVLWRNTRSGQNAIWNMNGVTYVSTVFLEALTDLGWTTHLDTTAPLKGRPDVLWRNPTTGQNALWYMNGVANIGTVFLEPVPDPAWVMVGTADMNADGQMDLVWRNTTTGQNAVWFMNGLARINTAFFESRADLAWGIAAVADFNGDGRPDLLWRNSTTGDNEVWYMTGLAHTGTAAVAPVPDVSWVVGGVADFDGDGQRDILWRSAATGQNAVWFMTGVTKVGGPVFLDTVADLAWRITGVADVNGDGQRDIVWRHTSTGQNAVWYMTGTTRTSTVFLTTVPEAAWVMVRR